MQAPLAHQAIGATTGLGTSRVTCATSTEEIAGPRPDGATAKSMPVMSFAQSTSFSPDGGRKASRRWPGDPARHYVAPGSAVATATCDDGSVEAYAGSRHRSALCPLRDPGFAWDQFDG